MSILWFFTFLFFVVSLTEKNTRESTKSHSICQNLFQHVAGRLFADP